MSALLSVRDLTVEWRSKGRRVLAVDRVSFDIEPGRALGLVGESGSGKSTTARAILGLAPAKSGSARFAGTELIGLGARGWRPLRRRIQVVFQDPFASLDPRQRVSAIVAEPLVIHGIGTRTERARRVAQMLDAVGLAPAHAARLPHEFSGGQRQRIAIARALILAPELLVCDEPVSALDVSVQAQIVNLLRDWQERRGLALLFISHDLAVVHHLCERVAVMQRGRIVEQAPRTQLFAAPAHPYTRALLAAVPVSDPEIERERRRTRVEASDTERRAPLPHPS
ncbi:MAG: ATP-binding cassette domain-containing protein [Planctomycetota bacterium]